jgi:hypothetical protein
LLLAYKYAHGIMCMWTGRWGRSQIGDYSMEIDTSITLEIDDDMITDAMHAAVGNLDISSDIEDIVKDIISNDHDIEGLIADGVNEKLEDLSILRAIDSILDNWKGDVSSAAYTRGVEHGKNLTSAAFVNPLTPVGICATPESMESLEKYAALFSGSEATVAATVMGMSWNLACATIDARLKELEL